MSTHSMARVWPSGPSGRPSAFACLPWSLGWWCLSDFSTTGCCLLLFRAVPSFELAISQAIYHSKWLLGRFLGLMKGIFADVGLFPGFVVAAHL
jgi:hypothetical protein